MTIIRRMTITRPVIYSISGLNKAKSILALRDEITSNGDRVIIAESENSISIDEINNRLVPDVIICDDFKPSRLFIKNTRRKKQWAMVLMI